MTDSILDCMERQLEQWPDGTPLPMDLTAKHDLPAGRRRAMLRGLGALAGWFDYAGDCEMSEWQAREHILERVRLPGFIRGRRFETQASEPHYFMLYETDDVNVFSSAPYLERLNNPTEWSRRCAAGLANMTRSVCRVVLSIGDIDGGHVATAEIEPSVAGEELRVAGNELRGALDDSLLAELIALPGVYAAHMLEADRAWSEIATVEKQLRASQDRVATWIVILEGRDRRSLEAGTTAVDVSSRLRQRGAGQLKGWRYYQLSFSATPSATGGAR